VGLIAGSLAPDLAYLLYVPASWSHQWPHWMLIDVGVAATFASWWTALVVPAMCPVVGRGPVVDWSKMASAPVAPGRTLIICSCLVGAATHILWDGLTHSAWWPARTFAHVRISGLALPGLLWKWTSYLGAMVLAVFLSRRFPAQRPWNWRFHRGLVLALLITLGCAGVTFARGLGDQSDPDRRWNATISALRVSLGVASLYLVARRRFARDQRV